VKRLAVVLPVVLLGLVVQPPASAGPSQTLCDYDPARGPVPAVFPLDACVEDAAVTVRNSLAVPVAVRAAGDVGAAARVQTSGGAAAALTRHAGGEDDVLMPGDVVRWPLGAGAGELTVTDTDVRGPAAVAVTLAPFLPDREDGGIDPVDQQAFGALIREVAPVVTARTACVRGTNFLRRAACDVDASAAIARAVADRLPGSVATEAMPEILDAATWREWSSTAALAVGLPDTGGRRLTLGARPVPPPVAPPSRPSPAAPEIAAPKPPPALAAAPPLPVPHGHAAPPGVDLEQWLRDLLEKAERTRADRDGDAKGNGTGNGHGHGHGKKD
jgi:hypothetical protein